MTNSQIITNSKDQITSMSVYLNKLIDNSSKTKKEIADDAGKSQSTIVNCLKKENFNVDSLLLILGSLGMSLKDFVTYMENSGYIFPTFSTTNTILNTANVERKQKDGFSKEQVEWRAGVESDS